MKKSNNLSPCCFSMVADHLALGYHGNVNLESNISLFFSIDKYYRDFLEFIYIIKMRLC